MGTLLDAHGREGLVIIAVDVDKDHAAAEKFLSKRHQDIRIVFDPKGEIAKAYALQGMPSSFLYDRKGVLRHTHLGFLEKDIKGLEAIITNLLAEGAGQETDGAGADGDTSKASVAPPHSEGMK